MKKQLALSKRSRDIRKAFEKASSNLLRATEASFEYSLLTAKAKKPHDIGEQIIKPTCLKIVERLCGPQVADQVKTVSFSDNTVTDRIDKMAGDCPKKKKSFRLFSCHSVGLNDNSVRRICAHSLCAIY